MSIIKVIPTSGIDDALALGCLIKLLDDYPEQLLNLYRIDRKQENNQSKHTFIALFLEPRTLGSLVAFINEWGARLGYDGTAPRGFHALMGCIEKHGFELSVYSWENDVLSEWKPRLDSANRLPVAERLNNWGNWVVENISRPLLPLKDF